MCLTVGSLFYHRKSTSLPFQPAPIQEGTSYMYSQDTFTIIWKIQQFDNASTKGQMDLGEISSWAAGPKKFCGGFILRAKVSETFSLWHH